MISLCYVVLQRVLQLVCIRVRSTASERTRGRRAAPRTRGPAPAGSAAGVSISRPTVLGSGEPDVAEGQLVVVSRHADHASAPAPASGGEPLDVQAPRRSSADQSGRSGIDRAVGTRKSTMGLPPHRGRAQGPGRDCVSDDCEEGPARGAARSSRQAQGSVVV